MTANLSFKATVLFKGEYLKIVYFRGSYYRTLLGNYRQAIEWYQLGMRFSVNCKTG